MGLLYLYLYLILEAVWYGNTELRYTLPDRNFSGDAKINDDGVQEDRDEDTGCI